VSLRVALSELERAFSFGYVSNELKDIPGFHWVLEKSISRLLAGDYCLKRLVETWKVWYSN